jgi:hypothetical protein
MLRNKDIFALLLACTALPLGAQTQPASSGRPAAEQSLKERFENLGLIYQDKKNPGLQELWVLGRYHGHYHDNDGSHGQDSGFESRRVRLGFQATMFDRLTVHAQAISGSDFEPAYNGFTELWVRWQFADSLNLTVGPELPQFENFLSPGPRVPNSLCRLIK